MAFRKCVNVSYILVYLTPRHNSIIRGFCAPLNSAFLLQDMPQLEMNPQQGGQIRKAKDMNKRNAPTNRSHGAILTTFQIFFKKCLKTASYTSPGTITAKCIRNQRDKAVPALLSVEWSSAQHLGWGPSALCCMLGAAVAWTAGAAWGIKLSTAVWTFNDKSVLNIG